MTTAQIFGQAVHKARLEAGMSRRKLAQTSGHGVSTIRRIEAGERACWAMTAADVARALDLDFNRALGR